MPTPTPPLALPALPEPATIAYVEGRAMQGGEYRNLAADYDESNARYSVRHMRDYATAAILADRAGRGDADSTIHRLQQPCKGKECGTTDSRYHSRACYLGHEEIVMYAACLDGPDEPAAARWEPIGWQYRMVFPTHASKWMDFLDLPVSEMATTKDFKYETRLVYAAPTGEAS